jgi:hypothetical protein
VSIKKLHVKVDDTRFFWMLIGSGKKKNLNLVGVNVVQMKNKAKLYTSFNINMEKQGLTRANLHFPVQLTFS